MGEFVRLEVDERVGTIRLDNPPRNVMSEQLSRELGEAAAEASERGDVGAVVVWGGQRIFAAGADIRTMADFGPEEIRPVVSALGDALDVLESVPKVTIAAINGFAVGGGCELALATDFRYAAEDARLGQPEILLGIIPGAGGTQRLPRLVGPGRARDLIYSGRQVTASEAGAMGLVDRVLPPAEVYRAAVEDAGRFARGPVEAIRAAKVTLGAVSRVSQAEGLELERDVFCDLFSTHDQKEGMRAFLEKRDAEFGGT